MTKQKEKIKRKTFLRPQYCLKFGVDCIFCNLQIDRGIDCQGMNSTDNYKEEKKE